MALPKQMIDGVDEAVKKRENEEIRYPTNKKSQNDWNIIRNCKRNTNPRFTDRRNTPKDGKNNS